MERRLSLRRASKKYNFIDVSSSSSSDRSQESEIFRRETLGKKKTIKTFAKDIDLNDLIKSKQNPKKENIENTLSFNKLGKKKEENRDILEKAKRRYIFSHELWSKEYYFNVIKLSKLDKVKQLIKENKKKLRENKVKGQQEQEFLQYKLNPELYLSIKKRDGISRRNKVFHKRF